MTKRRSILWTTGALCLCALLMIISSRRHATASAQFAAVQALLDTAVRDTTELLDRRATTQQVSLRARPAQDVIAQVNTVLAEAGLPSSHFKSLTSEPEAAVGLAQGEGAKFRRQSLKLVLEAMPPASLGAFLIGWRTDQPQWTVTRIELTHSHPRTGSTNTARKSSATSQPSAALDTDDANRYDAAITISSIYLADG